MKIAILFTSLLAVASAFPPQLQVESEKNGLSVCSVDGSDFDDLDNTLEGAEEEEEEHYNELMGGKRMLNDYICDKNQRYLPMPLNKKMTQKVSVHVWYSRSITYFKFKYSSMEKNQSSTMRKISGGPGHEYVEVEITSESDRIIFNWEIFCINNGFKISGPSNIKDIQSEQDLKSKLIEAGDKLVVLFFSAERCHWSKLIEPKIEKLSLEYLDVVFLRIDLDRTRNIFNKFNVTSTPTFIFIKHGEEIGHRVLGGEAENEVKEAIEKFKDAFYVN